MAVVGTAHNQQYNDVLQSYEHDPLRDLAEQFSSISRAGLNEQVDIFTEPRKFFMKSKRSI